VGRRPTGALVMIPVRQLNELQYCERLFHLMHVQGLFEDSADTVEGAAQHRRAEKRRRPSDTSTEEIWKTAPQSLYLGDEELGILGKLDAVRGTEKGDWEPIEAKHSSSPSRDTPFQVVDWTLSGEAWPNDQIQLCAQGLLLRANGFPSLAGRLFYRGNRNMVRIAFTDDLLAATKYFINRAKQLIAEPMPAPLVRSDKCFRCSLNSICLPDETNYLTEQDGKPRDIVPSRDDLGIVYVTEPGSRIGKHGDVLVISSQNSSLNVPLKDVAHISLFGNVQPSTQLIHECLERGIPVSYFTGGGRFLGHTMGAVTKNVQVRREQFRRFEDPVTRLELAKRIVRAKVLNQRTMLRRNANGIEKTVLNELAKLSNIVEDAASLDTLRGLEGRAARLYMEAFPKMLRHPVIDGESIMKGRNRRPPKDPVNALLSLAYSMLVRDFAAAISAVGMDYLFGFFHAVEPGRPALSLDLMEPFRSIIADSVVLRVLNTGEIQIDDFYIGNDSCSLKSNRRFFAAYERRMNEKITHPVFGYKLSYRRTLELEVRLLARYLEGDLEDYRPLVTR
jgi:CRISPR-associated protein Cas1